jgi:hypothetical protein
MTQVGMQCKIIICNSRMYPPQNDSDATQVNEEPAKLNRDVALRAV